MQNTQVKPITTVGLTGRTDSALAVELQLCIFPDVIAPMPVGSIAPKGLLYCSLTHSLDNASTIALAPLIYTLGLTGPTGSS